MIIAQGGGAGTRGHAKRLRIICSDVRRNPGFTGIKLFLGVGCVCSGALAVVPTKVVQSLTWFVFSRGEDFSVIAILQPCALFSFHASRNQT